MESYSYRKTRVTNKNSRSSLPLPSIASNSSDLSVSSGIISMCPLSINANDYLFIYDNSELIIKSDSFRFNSSNQSSAQVIRRSRSFNIETKLNKDEKLLTENQNDIKKELNSQGVKPLLCSKQEYERSIDSSLHLLLPRPKLSNETVPIERKQSPPPRPTTSVPICCPEISPERLNQFKQRQTELDRSVKRLIESVTIKANENINQIRKYWSYIKQITLDQYQPKTTNFQLFDYLLKSTYLNKQFDRYFEQNDEIKAALQMLSTTLTIVHDKHSFSTINRLYDNEEKLMIENLHYQLESLLSSYTDELSFIRESSHYYKSNLNEEKKFNWIQIIQIDYPCLIEKISNDFIIKIPQIEQILIDMLRNLKKNLLNNDIEINKK
jgi:hypothetical protein